MLISQITLYISAAPEMHDERDALGRLVPSIPTTLGWQILYTPHSDQPFNADAVAHAQIHLLVLGADIKAPVGWEWLLARRAGRRPALFRHERLRTPAADAFVRELEPAVQWRTYLDTPDLVKHVAALLVDHLLTRAAEYGLAQPETERLRAWLHDRSALSAPAGAARRVADANGVIFTAERYMPSEGRLVQ